LPETNSALPVGNIQDDENVKVGEDVHIFGFPGPYGFDRGEAVIRSGTICYKVNRYLYLLDANLWPGDSGGLVASKPYFGVPKENLGTYQWHFGRKVLGIEYGLQDVATFGLPKELQSFRTVTSGQAIREIFESPQFREVHDRLKKQTAGKQ
jgi:hypothetical protein